ncbi:MAG: hypothetical protein Q7S39_12525 [Ignavibacteria bacterium]|nr:hypothetical protein [Ignavibacteria bacterium]
MNVQTFEYPVFFRLLYRYGNIPVTFLLSLYLIPSVINLDKNLIYILPVIGILILIYFINKRYLFLYQVVPYKITADEEKLTCGSFFLSNKETIIYYTDIENLSGGIFSGKLKGLMKVYDGKSKICIGFFDKIKNVKSLQTLILSKVNSEVYNRVVESVGLRKKNK